MNFETSNSLFDPGELVNLKELYKAFMKLFRQWAELKTKYNKTERENVGAKKWKEFGGDVSKIKLQMTQWTADIERHKAANSVIGFFAKTIPPSSSSKVPPSSTSSTSNAALSHTSTTVSVTTSNNKSKEQPQVPPSYEKPKLTPAQETCMKKTDDWKNELQCINNKNFKTSEDAEKQKSLKKLYNSTIPKEIIFDSYCPSVKKDLKSRTCEDCGKYFATKKAKLSHRKSQVCTTSDDYLLESESDESSVEEFEEDNNDNNNLTDLPIINESSDPYAFNNVFANLCI